MSFIYTDITYRYKLQNYNDQFKLVAHQPYSWADQFSIPELFYMHKISNQNL